MTTQLQKRRGTTAEHSTFTGAEGEVTVDTTKDTAVVHDGVTAGGRPLAREDLNNVSTATVAAKLSGGTLTGNLAFGDNNKALFGAGSDLEIYHDTTKSIINDTGTGNLELQVGGVTKLATTTTGIDVTGTATMDGLSNIGSAYFYNASGPEIQVYEDSNNGTATIQFGSDDVVGATTSNRAQINMIGSNNNAGNLELQVKNDAGGLKRTAYFAYTGDVSFYNSTGSAAKLTWDASAESLGIGTTSPIGKLTLNSGASDASFYIQTTNTGGTASDGFSIAVENATSDVYINQRESANLRFYTAATERMRITSAGNVGIGTTSPSGKLTVSGIATLGSSASNNAVISRHTTPVGSQGVVISGGVAVPETTGTITYADTNAYGATITVGGNAADAFGGNIRLTAYGSGASGNNIIFSRRSGAGTTTDSMRLDASGNLLVGTTSTGLYGLNTGDGIELNNSSFIGVARASGVTAVFNRRTTDGSIVDFRKDGTTVGSIGTSDSTDRTYYVGKTLGLGFDTSSGGIFPVDQTGTIKSGVNLGASGARYADLFLSGGVYVGGTGAANYLDDYETGATAAITVSPATSGTITLTTNNTLAYEKVGDMVHVHGTLQVQSVSSPVGATCTITNLPFTVAVLTGLQERTGGSVAYYDASAGTITSVPFYVVSGTTIQFAKDASTIAASDDFTFSFSYRAA